MHLDAGPLAQTAIKWQDFVNENTGLSVDNATITGVVTDLDGETVQTFTLSFSTSQGHYTGTIGSSTYEFVDNQEYIIEITATAGTTVGYRRKRCCARYRGFDN